MLNDDAVLIFDGANSQIYHQQHSSYHHPIIIKLLKANKLSLGRIHQLHNELKLTQSLHVPGIRKALDYLKIGARHALILEFVDGQPLKEVFINQRRSLQDILNLAIALARRLDALHQRDIIHKDINPNNILVDPDSLSPTLIDFGIATQLDLKTSHLSHPEHLEGTLPYMSPEQTGRINRHIDYRTDFYALGITLYEVLTGHRPFEAADALGWVHAHLAAMPTPIREHNTDVPRALGAIVDKLMAKNAEDRYQSAYGLIHDLQACASQWQASGDIAPFELGQQDESTQFKLPEKLYGREREIECLIAGLDRVCQGSAELALISGFSGIGKSSIIDELIEPITRRRAYFVSGKFDQFHRDMPYVPLLDAFRGLLQQVLAGSDTQIHAWRQRLLEAVGANGQVLIDLIPEAEPILGVQPSVPDLDAEQNRNRFHLVLENFVRAIAQPEHPLVIFLDDLQWADGATLSLLKSWLETSDIGSLYLLGAYRDNEVVDGHPLQRMLKEIQPASGAPIGLQIEPLAVDDVANLLADTFKRTTSDMMSLANLLRQRTSGNPFFLRAFLTRLHTDGIIVFDHHERRWKWDEARIQQHEIAENIVDFMVDKIQRLSPAAQQTIETAACMGDHFTLPVLASLSPCSAEAIYDHLYESIAQGLIVPLSALIRPEANEIPELDYAFAHDRIRQAAYALVSAVEKPVIHRQIGDLLTRLLSEAQQEERLFDIVNHLNLGFAGSPPSDPEEATALERHLSHWNLRAGQKALASVAYGPAMNYFRLGLNRLSPMAWQSDYDLALALHTGMVESAYLYGDIDAMHHHADITLQKAETHLDRVSTYLTLMQAYKAQNQNQDAVSVGLEALLRFGIAFPKPATQADEAHAWEEVHAALADRPLADLAALPTVTDPEIVASIDLLSRLVTAAWTYDHRLYVLIAMKRLLLLLEHGNMAASSAVYSAYGLNLCNQGEIERGYQFGILAIQMQEKYHSAIFEARTQTMVNMFIRHWKEHLEETLPGFKKGYESGLEAGDIEFAASCLSGYCIHAFFAGHRLTALKSETLRCLKNIERTRQKKYYDRVTICYQLINNLQNEYQDPTLLAGLLFNETTNIQIRERSSDLDTLKLYYVCKLLLYHLFGKHHIALELIDTGHEWLPSRRTRCDDPWIVMLSALHQLASYATAAQPDQCRLLAAVDEQLALLEMWASHAPMNVLHKYHLVQAERLRVLGHSDEARGHYEKAIAGAKTQGYIHEEAMARELTGQFYGSIAHEELAAFYLQGAYRAYAEWGATAKCKHLSQRYPDWLSHVQRLVASPEDGLSTADVSTSSPTMTKSSPTGAQQLDLDSILKASQAISSELRLDALHHTLLQLTVQNAGAQNGYLLAGREGEWHVQAAGDIDHAPDPSCEPLPCPLAIVNYVQRTGETLVLANATRDERFQYDPRVRQRHILSVVCLALRHQGERAFILYLENNLTEHAFTPERVQILEMLMAQVAISLDNAQLYQDLQALNADLETRVKERTAQLQQAQQDLVEQAHRAGMADIATNVLHNVGNVLNTVTTSASVIHNAVGNSQAAKLVKANHMVEQHADDLDTFVKQDDKAAKLLRYYWLASQQIHQEQQDMLDNINLLQDKVQLINEIVVAQQSYAQGRALDDTLILEEIVELALTLQGASAERHDVTIERDFSPIAPVRGQKTKLVHVIVNLIKNAIEAMKDAMHDRKHLTLSIEAEADTAYLRVRDTGCGIAPQMLEAIFIPRTSTKPEGHGFGLHSSANYMAEMGGRLWAESAGEGQGATFIVTLPCPVNDREGPATPAPGSEAGS